MLEKLPRATLELLASVLALVFALGISFLVSVGCDLIEIGKSTHLSGQLGGLNLVYAAGMIILIYLFIRELLRLGLGLVPGVSGWTGSRQRGDSDPDSPLV